jgi:hypothetical protein
MRLSMIYRKSVYKIQVWLKSDKNNWYFTWTGMHTYDILLNCSYNEKRFRQKL